MADARPPTELQPERIVMTLELLAERIEARFPDRGLTQVARETRLAAGEAVTTAKLIQQPVVYLRVISCVLITAMVVIVGKLALAIKISPSGGWDMLEGIDAGISATVYLGLAVLFLVTLESRLKRRRSLRALQELRALAHVIDMHQLSKDPEWAQHRESSPLDSEQNHLEPFLLGRYLDYCVDLLALIGKVAALYAQNNADGVVLQAVEEVENLTATLATKIWQKIMVLDQIERQGK
ncbi:MAG: hypothetical protein AAGC44_03280 [Planctomycetota bacterium]